MQSDVRGKRTLGETPLWLFSPQGTFTSRLRLMSCSCEMFACGKANELHVYGGRTATESLDSLTECACYKIQQKRNWPKAQAESITLPLVMSPTSLKDSNAVSIITSSWYFIKSECSEAKGNRDTCRHCMRKPWMQENIRKTINGKRKMASFRHVSELQQKTKKVS